MRAGSSSSSPVARSIIQPGRSGLPCNAWFLMVPYDTTVVAMSRITGASCPAGMPTASGLVPSSDSEPPNGAMWLALATAE